MKYLKYFEDTEENIIGEYVLLDLDLIEEEGYAKDVVKFIDSMAIIVKYEEEQNFAYTVKFYTDTTLTVSREEIIRKLTPKEIENYKYREEIHKFNI